jgi:hypothetical protein
MADVSAPSKGIFSRVWDSQFEQTAPPIREEAAYQELEIYNSKTQQFEPFGIFVHDRLEKALAKDGLLKEQVEYRQWQQAQIAAGSASTPDALKRANPALYNALFYANGTAKTALDLAILPATRKSKEAVREAVKADVRFHRKNMDKSTKGPNFAPMTSKMVLQQLYFEDFLTKEAYQVHLAKGTLPANTPRVVLKGEAKSVIIDANNPSAQATTREKVIHAVTSWVGLLMTISLTAAAFSAPTFLMSAVYASLAFLANWVGNDFDMFGKAKILFRELSWLTESRFSWIRKFSPTNTVKSLAILSATIFGSYEVAAGAHSLMMGSSFLAAYPPVQAAITTLMTGIAFVSTFIAIMDSLKYRLGFGWSNNQVAKSEMEAVATNRGKASAKVAHPKPSKAVTSARDHAERQTPAAAPREERSPRRRQAFTTS